MKRLTAPNLITIALVSGNLLLAGCGGGSGSGSDSNKSDSGNPLISGAVAVGTGVNGATVSIKCQSGTGVGPVTTTANGHYEVEIPKENFPCIFRASGGNLSAGTKALYSYLKAPNSNNNVNITPLTDMALSYAVSSASGQSVEDWFASPASWSEVTTGLNDAAGTLRDKLINAGYSLPSQWTSSNAMLPFNEVFTPSATPNAGTLDALLETLKQAWGNASTNYDDFLVSLMSGGQFPDPPVSSGSGSGSTAEAVAKADFGVNDSPTTAEFLAIMSTEWPVAIYKVPAGKESWYGKGKVVFGGTTENWTITLYGADGSVIADQSEEGSFTSALTAFKPNPISPLLKPSAGQIFINKGVTTASHISVFIYHDSGLIDGFAGGGSEVRFRNSLNAYGDAVPDVFSLLAGSWSSSEKAYCDGAYGPETPVTNSAAITSNGKVTLDGMGQLCQSVLPQSAQWGGKDDFLMPDPDAEGYLLTLDNASVKLKLNTDFSLKRIDAFLPDLVALGTPVKQ